MKARKSTDRQSCSRSEIRTRSSAPIRFPPRLSRMLSFPPDGGFFFTVSSMSDDPDGKKTSYAIDVFDTISGPKPADWPVRDELAATLDYLSRERRGARPSCVTSTEDETAADVKTVIGILEQDLKDTLIGGRSCSFTVGPERDVHGHRCKDRIAALDCRRDGNIGAAAGEEPGGADIRRQGGRSEPRFRRPSVPSFFLCPPGRQAKSACLSRMPEAGLCSRRSRMISALCRANAPCRTAPFPSR